MLALKSGMLAAGDRAGCTERSNASCAEAWTGGTSKKATLGSFFISEKLTDYMNTSERRGSSLKIGAPEEAAAPSITRPSVTKGSERSLGIVRGEKGSSSLHLFGNVRGRHRLMRI